MENKIFYFKVSGKLEAENEAEAINLIHDLLGEQTQFQIDSIEE